MLALVPTPIGVGPAYHPRPAVHGTCTPAPILTGDRIHLELFAHGRVVIVPAAVGIGGPRKALGRVRSARCRARTWTLDPTGVVQFVARASIADFFRVWGEPLTKTRLLTFRGVVRVYVNGKRRRGDPRTLVLRDHDEIVLEVGPFIPPHRSYRFPPH